MTATYERMELCARLVEQGGDADTPKLIEQLSDPEWRVRYAAAIAAGDLRLASAVDALVRVLGQEDEAPIYGQPSEMEAGGGAGATEVTVPAFPEGTTLEMQEAWRRRGRLKQAACLALGQIGIADPHALAVLHRYAVSMGDDYGVRAAACLALGQIGDPSSKPALTQAATDEEWCTRTEAQRALARLA